MDDITKENPELQTKDSTLRNFAAIVDISAEGFAAGQSPMRIYPFGTTNNRHE